MEDLISRQAAIEAIEECRKVLQKGVGWELVDMAIDGQKAINEIKGLPSAQPEIIRCKDCKNWDTTWQNNFAPNHYYCPMIDLVRNGDFYCADAERKTDE